MLNWIRRRSNTTAETPEEKPPHVAQESNEPLTERQRLLHQQYERLASHHAIAEAEDQARHYQDS